MLDGRGGNTADYKRAERFAFKQITGQDGQPSPYELTDKLEEWNLQKAKTAQEREMKNHPEGTSAAAWHQIIHYL